MNRCAAPWYELNISAPDNCVSACCFYAGQKDLWHDEPRDIREYWQSSAMRTIRQINGLKELPGPNGCSTCFYFQNRKEGHEYFKFDVAFPDLSAAQRDNLNRARQDFEQGIERVTCTPLRIYANFGFACNLSCTMCHQVPRRGQNSRQVRAETILSWRDALKAALDVTVIGGEPFVLPEAVAFIRAFVEEPEYDSVRLTICTNGTVHHKHLQTLRKKRKLSLAVSLDSIGAAYEQIRVDGKWNVVEKNILDFVEIQRTDRPDWSLQTNALVLKRGIPLLPQFAEWHARHGIVTSFYDFINSRGTEDAFYSENALHNPQVLDDLPDWEHYFNEAVSTFKKAGQHVAANSLDHYRQRLVEAVHAHRKSRTAYDRLQRTNAWECILEASSADALLGHFAYSAAPGAANKLLKQEGDRVIFSEMRMGDHLATAFHSFRIGPQGGVARVRLRWPADETMRRAHMFLQNDALHEIETVREPATRRDGTFETVLMAKLQPGSHRFRLIAAPVGEIQSALPSRVEFAIGGDAQTFTPEAALSAAFSSVRSGTIKKGAQARMAAGAFLRSHAPVVYRKLTALRNRYRDL